MCPTSDSDRRSGRPTDEHKTQRILEAAHSLLSELGLFGTSMEAVAAKAGVAKTTLYARFADKNALLEAVIDWVVTPFEEVERLEASNRSIRDALNGYGFYLASAVENARISGLEPAILVSSSQNKYIARMFHKKGPGRVRELLSSAMAEWCEQERLSKHDETDTAERMAEDLLSLWRGLFSIEMRLEHAGPPPPELIRARIERGTDRFLHLYGTPLS